jgi:hypothetical protein
MEILLLWIVTLMLGAGTGYGAAAYIAARKTERPSQSSQ